MNGLHDAHCHLDFSPEGVETCARAAKAGWRIFINTVTPAGHEMAAGRFSGAGNAAVGVGLHPWWIHGLDDEEIARGVALASEARFIGEVGLDFGKKGLDPERQLDAFGRIAQACGSAGGKVVSIHSVRAAGEALDILSASRTLESCICIFHWFSGTSDELRRALDAGCLFSVNPVMAGSRRGREYIRQLPASRILLESDLPESDGDSCPFEVLAEALAGTLDAIAAIKGDGAREEVLETGRRLFS